MGSVDEAVRAVRELAGVELAEYRRWFYEFDARVRDAKLGADGATGKLDELAERALTEYRAGRTRPS
jgi:hypothetical protein